ncbi:MAG: glycosyltransferase [Microcella sp.]
MMIAVDQGRGFRHPFTLSMVRQRVASERALIARWKPDAIVIGTTLTLFISARAEGVPLVYVRPYAMSRGHLAEMTSYPVSSGTGLPARALNRMAGWSLRHVARALRWIPRSFRRVALENGVRLPARTVEAIDADLNLIASLFPYLDQRRSAAGEEAVGPVYAHGDGELPQQVLNLADRRRPAVYVGLGSSGSRELALSILGELGSLDIDVISSVGRFLTEHDRALLPANAQVFDYLPAHRLAGLIDASVIHGGEGTVQTACASGAPFAGIGLQAEQRFNIDECVQYGNALRFTARDLRRGRLPAIVARLLSDAALRGSAHRLQEAMVPLGASNSARSVIAFAREGGARAE